MHELADIFLKFGNASKLTNLSGRTPLFADEFAAQSPLAQVPDPEYERLARVITADSSRRPQDLLSFADQLLRNAADDVAHLTDESSMPVLIRAAFGSGAALGALGQTNLRKQFVVDEIRRRVIEAGRSRSNPLKRYRTALLGLFRKRKPPGGWKSIRAAFDSVGEECRTNLKLTGAQVTIRHATVCSWVNALSAAEILDLFPKHYHRRFAAKKAGTAGS